MLNSFADDTEVPSKFVAYILCLVFDNTSLDKRTPCLELFQLCGAYLKEIKNQQCSITSTSLKLLSTYLDLDHIEWALLHNNIITFIEDCTKCHSLPSLAHIRSLIEIILKIQNKLLMLEEIHFILN